MFQHQLTNEPTKIELIGRAALEQAYTSSDAVHLQSALDLIQAQNHGNLRVLDPPECHAFPREIAPTPRIPLFSAPLYFLGGPGTFGGIALDSHHSLTQGHFQDSRTPINIRGSYKPSLTTGHHPGRGSTQSIHLKKDFIKLI